MTEPSFSPDLPQRQLLQLLVEKTLKKHGVTAKQVQLTAEEKEQIRQMVQQLQAQVQQYLESLEQRVTEHDVDPNTHTPTKKQGRKTKK
ncbi:hypothetical protein MKY25_13735 [Geobacillus sp. FSL W8-0032]|uniref:Spore coat protein n=2 Tax=Geobacillus TaxID=129337 RepID=A0A679FL09_9BACL|nr:MULTISPECIES: hypothetical protein [Geobacillus]KYD24391.1 hypothetical protein B4113_2425 [Geobacillus sp. B4113_201601]MEB3749221.1 hypothetical protein [Geobacillus icigianus]BBW97058.1 hypothetical protein GsuE55_18910 [Geobacillus subterraneus]